MDLSSGHIIQIPHLKYEFQNNGVLIVAMFFLLPINIIFLINFVFHRLVVHTWWKSFFSLMDSSDTLEIRDKSLQPDPGIDQILREFPVVENEISYQDFFENFIIKNLPCLIKTDSGIRSWPSFNDWVTPGLIIYFLVWL